MADDTLDICETFASIQGESTFAGLPCFFIRLAGCNLRCAYCDTPYAFEAGRPMASAELVRHVRESGVSLVEVTGGEPLLQAGTVPLLRQLHSVGTVLLETNGTRDISVIPDAVVAIMDIKCPGSGMVEAFDARNIRRLRPHDEVKFVLTDRGDYEWAKNLLLEHRLDSRCHAVLLSPAPGRLEPAALVEWMLADRLPVRLNLQLHKLIWNPSSRGV
ncbi:MAG: radical SAM protein [Lentisphaerae bacterium]|nr:radical SAM protein [Lentisphaerota bacterium]